MVWTVLFNKLLWFGSQLPRKDKKPSAKIERFIYRRITVPSYHKSFMFYAVRSKPMQRC
jgi:hypothetical protein